MRNTFKGFAGGTLAAGLAWLFAYQCSGATEEVAHSVATLQSGALSGAIFTTVADGTRINANSYERKEDVYLDGGPGPNAPAGAAGLPAGDYYFQVTDPSGKTLLSSDPVSCRRVHVADTGVIDRVYTGTTYVRSRGRWVAASCAHETGTDADHAELGAITVQLFPYADTPNKGGVYKAWLTPVAEYRRDATAAPAEGGDKPGQAAFGAGSFFGFAPSASKTDNFKVKRRGPPQEPMLLTVRKFHDANVNAAMDTGEAEISRWRMGVVDPLGGSNDYYTRAEILASEGTWLVIEDRPEGTTETVAFLDGERQSSAPTADPIVSVIFDGASGEHHEVLYGDCGTGSVVACKVYDRNANGAADEGEPGVAGWSMSLEGTDATGETVSLVALTGADGCADFGPLLPGTYVLREAAPSGPWQSTGETSAQVNVTSTLDGATLSGTRHRVAFTNLCTATAAFGTKGYWHNKNGLGEMQDADIAYVNGLPPYASPSSYFGEGDEPFDGRFTSGAPVEAQLGDSDETIAPAGSARAEVSRFLVDPNAGADPREQLAQQLLAFLFNVRQRLDDPGAVLVMPDGSYRPAGEIVADAIAAWAGGTAEQQHEMQALLDAYNNSDAVRFVRHAPCDVPAP